MSALSSWSRHGPMHTSGGMRVIWTVNLRVSCQEKGYSRQYSSVYYMCYMYQSRERQEERGRGSKSTCLETAATAASPWEDPLRWVYQMDISLRLSESSFNSLQVHVLVNSAPLYTKVKSSELHQSISSHPTSSTGIIPSHPIQQTAQIVAAFAAGQPTSAAV